MKYYFAPLEGVTTHIFRNTHAKYFAPADKYYMPFVSPCGDRVFTPKELRELAPEKNIGVNAVPQLLVKNSGDCLWAIRELEAMGFAEINLNIGCPSGTVVSKGKGCGLFRDLEHLDALLDGIYSAAKGDISIKTRLGLESAEEFEKIFEIYKKYPISELTVHPRVQKDFYKLPVRMEAYNKIETEYNGALCYNGDIANARAALAFGAEHDGTGAIMIGRGAVGDPSVFGRLRGGESLDRAALRAFHDEVFAGYRQAFGNDGNAMRRMKEIWTYMANIFADSGKHSKRLKKSTRLEDYNAAVNAFFADLEFAAEIPDGFMDK